MRTYALIEDGHGNYRYGYEQLEEEQKPSQPDHKSMLRALLRDADEVTKQMTLEELKAKITAILPGASFEVDGLGQIVIRASCRLHTDPEALAESLREKARTYIQPRKGRFGRTR